MVRDKAAVVVEHAEVAVAHPRPHRLVRVVAAVVADRRGLVEAGATARVSVVVAEMVRACIEVVATVREFSAVAMGLASIVAATAQGSARVIGAVGMPGLLAAGIISVRAPASGLIASGVTVSATHGVAFRSSSMVAITTAIAIGSIGARSRREALTGGIATIHAGTGTGDRLIGWDDKGRPSGRPF